MLKIAINRLKKFVRDNFFRDWENVTNVLVANVLMSDPGWQTIPESRDPFWIQKKEFRVYSQFGDDGIIQWLVQRIGPRIEKKFIEFGVGDYYESNTHFLLINNRWEGFVMDGDPVNIRCVQKSPIYWRYGITARNRFVTRENINFLLKESGFEKIGLLHIDLDGNDYWVLRDIDLTVLDPDILVLEYNSHFGNDWPVTIPYDPNFTRHAAHYSGLYFGASLSALNNLAEQKGYFFVGCNSAGNNAYFLSNKHLSIIPKFEAKEGFQEASFRDARDINGKLKFEDNSHKAGELKGMRVINVLDDCEVFPFGKL